MAEKDVSNCSVYQDDLDRIQILRRRRRKKNQQEYIRYLLDKDEQELKQKDAK